MTIKRRSDKEQGMIRWYGAAPITDKRKKQKKKTKKKTKGHYSIDVALEKPAETLFGRDYRTSFQGCSSLQFVFVRLCFHMLCLCCHFVFPISPSFSALGELCFLTEVFRWHLHLYVY